MELIRGGMELGDLKASETIVGIVSGVLCLWNLRLLSKFEEFEQVFKFREIHGFEDEVEPR